MATPPAGTKLTTTPSVIAPTQLFDGILVSGNHDIGATRNPTYTYQRLPIVEELLRRQAAGQLVFPGVVVTRCLISQYHGKRRSAYLAAEAAHMLGADAAIISIEECGHAYADLMLTCEACETLGIQTTLVMAESAGATGESTSVLAFSDKARAVVTVGNMDEVVSLPAVDVVMGGAWFRGRWLLDEMVYEAVDTPLTNIFAATCQVGPGNLTTEVR